MPVKLLLSLDLFLVNRVIAFWDRQYYLRYTKAIYLYPDTELLSDKLPMFN